MNLDKLKQEATGEVIKVAAGELYDADADHRNIAYFEEKVSRKLDTLIDHIYTTLTDEMVERLENKRKVKDYENGDPLSGTYRYAGGTRDMWGEEYAEKVNSKVEAHNQAITQAQTIIKDSK